MNNDVDIKNFQKNEKINFLTKEKDIFNEVKVEKKKNIEKNYNSGYYMKIARYKPGVNPSKLINE